MDYFRKFWKPLSWVSPGGTVEVVRCGPALEADIHMGDFLNLSASPDINECAAPPVSGALPCRNCLAMTLVLPKF